MRHPLRPFARSLMALAALLLGTCPIAQAGRTTESFDADWRFLQADPAGASTATLDDSSWRSLSVPHDWSIEGAFDAKNTTGPAGGCLPAGVGWYRKQFKLPASDTARRVFIDFDGVMANSDVWINGFHLGKRPYGYVSFRYELSGHLNFGDKPNLLAVRVDNAEQPASRWYAGAGIYRHVRLVRTDPVHIEYNGTFVTTPTITDTSTTVRIQTTVVNDSDTARQVTVAASIQGPPQSAPDGPYAFSGESAVTSIPAGKSQMIAFDIPSRMAVRKWDLDQPAMHQAVVRVRSSDQTLDEETIPFGIRTAEFKPESGFWLNGKNFKLNGVCLHSDAGALGVAIPLEAWERRLRLLKEVGCNAIRTAHNPPAPEFLDLCDRMGFLVMDEMFDCWTVAKNKYDYHLYFNEWSKIDTRDTVRRDRNHPSVIMYSAGNEIKDTPKAEMAYKILKGLVEVFHAEDPTRPVTQALFRPNVSKDYDNGLADLLDVVGQNYRENEIVAAHLQKPTRSIVGTENGKDAKAWAPVRDNAFHSGHFIWTGIDYLGEGRRWPRIGSTAGLFDTTGHPYPIAFQRQSWWSEKPMVYMTRDEGNVPTGNAPGEPQTRRVQSADWTPRSTTQPTAQNIEVYSNCDTVEVLLNDKSLGVQQQPREDQTRSWKVNFEPGMIKAIARNKGSDAIVATHELRSAGKAAKVALAAHRSKLAPVWDEVSYVTATIVDENGIVIPRAEDLVKFKIEGPGAIVAVDNGNLSSHEMFKASERHAYRGRCIAIVRATAPGGQIKLTASAAGLADASVSLEVVKP